MVDGHKSGNWLGPTILANVTMDMDVWSEEIFAPVLVCLEVGAAQGVLESDSSCVDTACSYGERLPTPKHPKWRWGLVL